MSKTKIINLTNGVLTKKVLEKIKNMNDFNDEPNILQLGQDVTLPDNCTGLFSNTGHFSKIIFNKGIDTSNVTNMKGMFDNCYNLTKIEGLKYLDTSNVIDMSDMFNSCDLKDIDLSNFNYDKVENISNMLSYNGNLSNIDGFDKLKDKIKELGWIKSNWALKCTGELVETDYFEMTDIISEFGVTVEPDVSKKYDKIITVNKGEISNTSIRKILLEVSKNTDVVGLVPKIDKCKLILGENVKLIDTFRSFDEDGLFCKIDDDLKFDIECIEFKKGVDSNTMIDMSEMFYNCGNLKEIIGLGNLDTSKIENISYMFYNCSKLQSLDLSNFDTSNVFNMEKMFGNCGGLQSLDLSSFDTSNVINMEFMFDFCSSIETLNLSSFDTSNVVSMSFMFNQCSGLKSLDLSSFDTSKVTTMYYMFHNNDGLQSLDLSSFDTSNVKDMEDMFGGCSSLKSLDLSSFNTSKVTNMDGMFENCSSLEELDLSTFEYDNVNTINYICDGCVNLYHIDGYNKLLNTCHDLDAIKPHVELKDPVVEEVNINISNL